MNSFLVTLLTASEMHLARFIKEKFEFEGIECFLTDENLSHEDGKIFGGLHIKVKASDTERAVKLLLSLHKQYDFNKVEITNTLADLKKLLVPVKLSDYSLNACSYAFSLAQKLYGEIKLLHTYEDSTMQGVGKQTTSWMKHAEIASKEAFYNAQDQMLELRSRIKNEISDETLDKVKSHFALMKGTLLRLVLNLTSRYKPDLIVLGSKGDNDKESDSLCETISEVIKETKYPVLVVPKTAQYPQSDKLKIMYASNFNEADSTSLNKMLEILKPFDKEIHCIHFDTEKNNEKKKQMELLKQQQITLHKDENLNFSVVEVNDILTGFNEFAKNHDIDIISFSSPKRSLIYRLFNPNNLKNVVNSSKIPLLIFPVA